MDLHRLQIKYFDEDGFVQETIRTVSDEGFMQLYQSGKIYDCRILSMVWAHKGEINKLIFGD